MANRFDANGATLCANIAISTAAEVPPELCGMLGFSCVQSDARVADANTSTDVGDCERTVDMYIAQCRSQQADSPLLCLYPGYRKLCSQGGRPSVVAQMFACMQGDACKVPSNSAAACIGTLVESNRRTVDDQIARRACSFDTTGCQPSLAPPQYAEQLLLNDAAAASILTCSASSTTAAEMRACANQVEPFSTWVTCGR